jgi:hypothetical protein
MSWRYFRSKLGCAICQAFRLGFVSKAVVVIAAAEVKLLRWAALQFERRLATWKMEEGD